MTLKISIISQIYFTKETSDNNNIYTYGSGNDTFILPDTLPTDFSTVLLQKEGRDLNVKECNAFVVKINDASTQARRFALFEIINRLGWGEIKYDNRIKTIEEE